MPLEWLSGYLVYPVLLGPRDHLEPQVVQVHQGLTAPCLDRWVRLVPTVPAETPVQPVLTALWRGHQARSVTPVRSVLLVQQEPTPPCQGLLGLPVLLDHEVSRVPMGQTRQCQALPVLPVSLVLPVLLGRRVSLVPQDLLDRQLPGRSSPATSATRTSSVVLPALSARS